MDNRVTLKVLSGSPRGSSPYATTKRGLLGLTETLAIELGDGIASACTSAMSTSRH